MPPPEYVRKGAIISSCGRYRYLLWREWRGCYDPKHWRHLGAKDGNGADWEEPKACVFVMLNPSKADGEVDDPTIRRCVAFAKAWRFDRLEVVNLFAYRATQPRELLALTHDDDPVGVRNQEVIESVTAEAGRIVCAWGAHGSHIGQNETARGWMLGPDPLCLGLTGAGHPRHPLYVAADTPLVPLP